MGRRGRHVQINPEGQQLQREERESDGDGDGDGDRLDFLSDIWKNSNGPLPTSFGPKTTPNQLCRDECQVQVARTLDQNYRRAGIRLTVSSGDDLIGHDQDQMADVNAYCRRWTTEEAEGAPGAINNHRVHIGGGPLQACGSLAWCIPSIMIDYLPRYA